MDEETKFKKQKIDRDTDGAPSVFKEFSVSSKIPLLYSENMKTGSPSRFRSDDYPAYSVSMTGARIHDMKELSRLEMTYGITGRDMISHDKLILL